MKESYFDAHTHAHFAVYGDEKKAVIDRALANEVEMILVGTQKDTSKEAVEWANQYEDGVWAAVALHPSHTIPSEYIDAKELGDMKASGEADHEVFEYEYYKKLALDPKVVAIGECGLDYFRLDQATKKKQEEVLIQHMQLSKEVDKPLTIHCRDAFDDLITIFKANKELLRDVPGTLHFFTGSVEHAKALMELGFSFQFGGVITFTKDYNEVINTIPMDMIITETDAPYVAPVPHRGKRNEPAYVVEVVKRLALLKGLEVDEVRNQVRKNVQTVFGV